MLLAALFCLPALRAQNLVIGARVADLKVSEYVVGQQPDDNRPVLVEFFFSASEPSRKRIPVLDDLARRQAGKVSVVLLSREGADKIVPLFEGTNYAFAVALDDEGLWREVRPVQRFARCQRACVVVRQFVAANLAGFGRFIGQIEGRPFGRHDSVTDSERSGFLDLQGVKITFIFAPI